MSLKRRTLGGAVAAGLLCSPLVALPSMAAPAPVVSAAAEAPASPAPKAPAQAPAPEKSESTPVKEGTPGGPVKDSPAPQAPEKKPTGKVLTPKEKAETKEAAAKKKAAEKATKKKALKKAKSKKVKHKSSKAWKAKQKALKKAALSKRAPEKKVSTKTATLAPAPSARVVTPTVPTRALTATELASVNTYLTATTEELTAATLKQTAAYRLQVRQERSLTKASQVAYAKAAKAQAGKAKVHAAVKRNARALETSYRKLSTPGVLVSETTALLKQRTDLKKAQKRADRQAASALKAYGKTLGALSTAKKAKAKEAGNLTSYNALLSAAKASPTASPYTVARLGRQQMYLAQSQAITLPGIPTSSVIAASKDSCNTNTEVYGNGLIPQEALCPILEKSPNHGLRASAARDLNAMADAYEAHFKKPFCLTDSYRSYAAQVDVKRRKPTLAAKPGTSNHGLGFATDLCGGIGSFGTPEHEWMRANAPYFGWNLPTWARADGSKPEAWHWEYITVGDLNDAVK